MNGQGANSVNLNLALNSSPPSLPFPQAESPTRSVNSSSMETISPTSSCVSSEISFDESSVNMGMGGGGQQKAKPMMLMGCPRCLMYVIVAQEDPKCPQCKTPCLFEVLHHDEIAKKPAEGRNRQQLSAGL